MSERYPYLRPATEADEPFLYDVFATTWEQEVASMPNPALVAHFLRIQYTAQERRFAARYPRMQRFVITHEGEAAGRYYAQYDPQKVHAIEMTLLPQFRSLGIGSRLVREGYEEARETGRTITLRVSRRNDRAFSLYSRLGFRLIAMDDLDRYYEWDPARESTGPLTDTARAAG